VTRESSKARELALRASSVPSLPVEAGIGGATTVSDVEIVAW
jgi:hypothetical protein